MQKQIAQPYKPSIIDVSCIFWQTTIIIYLLVEWLTFTGLNNLQFEFLASFERLVLAQTEFTHTNYVQ